MRKVRLNDASVLVIQSNSDGRPCGWGLFELTSADTPACALKAAEAEADRQYAAHQCYVNEKRGKVLVYWLDGGKA